MTLVVFFPIGYEPSKSDFTMVRQRGSAIPRKVMMCRTSADAEDVAANTFRPGYKAWVQPE